MQTRRVALLTIAGAAATPLFSQEASKQAGHAMAEATPTAISYAPAFFKQPDYEVICKVADLILPRTDTPGALDAKVPFHIDHEVAASPALQAAFETGLALLQGEVENAGATNFVLLSDSQQMAILTSMSEVNESPARAFFQTIKSLTVDWYYRSEEGLVKELGFHGNTFRPNFPGCTHPEHWPTASKAESK